MKLKKIRKRTEYDAYKRSRMESFEFLNKNYCKKGATVLVGDSITELYMNADFFAEYFEKTGTPVYNRGISGDTSDRLLDRIEKTVLNIKPKNMVLLIGTNDIGIGADNDFIAENVEKIIEQSKKRCKSINIILEAVYPINTKIRKQGRRNNGKILLLNEKLKSVAERQRIEFVDLTSALSDEDGMFKAEYTYDGLHANANAYEIVTRAVLPLLK